VSLLYILDGKVPVPCEDAIAWAQWVEAHEQERIVCQEDVGPWWVSTVFLGVDHNYVIGHTPPQLFETMIFEGKGGDPNDYQTRTSTWELALEQHAQAVVWAKEQMH
jgi:hypothetical protein